MQYLAFTSWRRERDSRATYGMPYRIYAFDGIEIEKVPCVVYISGRSVDTTMSVERPKNLTRVASIQSGELQFEQPDSREFARLCKWIDRGLLNNTNARAKVSREEVIRLLTQ